MSFSSSEPSCEACSGLGVFPETTEPAQGDKWLSNIYIGTAWAWTRAPCLGAVCGQRLDRHVPYIINVGYVRRHWRRGGYADPVDALLPIPYEQKVKSKTW